MIVACPLNNALKGCITLAGDVKDRWPMGKTARSKKEIITKFNSFWNIVIPSAIKWTEVPTIIAERIYDGRLIVAKIKY